MRKWNREHTPCAKLFKKFAKKLQPNKNKKEKLRGNHLPLLELFRCRRLWFQPDSLPFSASICPFCWTKTIGTTRSVFSTFPSSFCRQLVLMLLHRHLQRHPCFHSRFVRRWRRLLLYHRHFLLVFLLLRQHPFWHRRPQLLPLVLQLHLPSSRQPHQLFLFQHPSFPLASHPVSEHNMISWNEFVWI